jgi:peroxiredoxin
VRRFIANMHLKLPVVRDADGAAAKAFGINIFPSTVAIDREGRVRFIVVGEMDWAGAAGRDVLRDLA